MDEDFRVEIDLDDERHGYSFGERLRAFELDEEARTRLGRNIVISRDGPRVFAYASTERQAREAEQVLRSLVLTDDLTADVHVTRWHPVAEEWVDVSVPLPETQAEVAAEYAAREAAETVEGENEGRFDWYVNVELASRDEARELADRLAADGEAVGQRWRYVVVGAVTEERAEALAERLRTQLGESAKVEVEASLDDVEFGPFQFVGF